MSSKPATPKIHDLPPLEAIFIYDFRLQLVLSLAGYSSGCADRKQVDTRTRDPHICSLKILDPRDGKMSIGFRVEQH